MQLLKTLNRLTLSLHALFNIEEDYSRKDINNLWKLSGLSIEQVANDLCVSFERAKDLCYGRGPMTKKPRVDTAHYFQRKVYNKYDRYITSVQRTNNKDKETRRQA